MGRLSELISAGAERLLRPILAHSIDSFAAARRPPERLDTLPRVVSFDDVPVAGRRMMCGQPEQGFERNVPMEAAIVAKDEFIEVGVDVRAPQSMIRAQAPSLHQ